MNKLSHILSIGMVSFLLTSCQLVNLIQLHPQVRHLDNEGAISPNPLEIGKPSTLVYSSVDNGTYTVAISESSTVPEDSTGSVKLGTLSVTKNQATFSFTVLPAFGPNDAGKKIVMKSGGSYRVGIYGQPDAGGFNSQAFSVTVK